jgi:hypothetical protein
VLDFLNDLQVAFNFLKVLDTGVRQVQAAIPAAAGSTKLNVVLGTIEGAINAADETGVSFAAVQPALTGAINAMVASYKAVGDPAFAAPATTAPATAPVATPAAPATSTVA